MVWTEQRRPFAATRWSLVRRAQGAEAQARDALAELCRIYWYPLYAWVRKTGLGPDDAADLTQAFFARILEKRDLDSVDPRYGRFSSWLRASMNHFLANEWDKLKAQRRGGGLAPVPIDAAAADEAWLRETTDGLTPEKLYDRKMTLAVLDRVEQALGREYEARGAGRRFERLKEALRGKTDQRYAEIAAELGMTEGAVKRAVFSLKERHRALLWDEVAQLVDDERDIRREIEGMLQSLT